MQKDGGYGHIFTYDKIVLVVNLRNLQLFTVKVCTKSQFNTTSWFEPKQDKNGIHFLEKKTDPNLQLALCLSRWFEVYTKFEFDTFHGFRMSGANRYMHSHEQSEKKSLTEVNWQKVVIHRLRITTCQQPFFFCWCCSGFTLHVQYSLNCMRQILKTAKV